MGRNVLLDLPTGTGKTNVSLLALLAIAARHTPTAKKFLFIVPTRTLVVQVSSAARWLSPILRIAPLTEEITNSTSALRTVLDRNEVVVTTPAVFANRLATGAIDARYLSQLCGAVIDEFDEFLALNYSATGRKVRLDVSLESLLEQIPSTPLLLMSGTVPQKTGDFSSFSTALLASFVQKRFRPALVTAPTTAYEAYIPAVAIHVTTVPDDLISSYEQMLATEMRDRMRDFDCNNETRLDWNWVLERSEYIGLGRVRYAPSWNGKFRITPALRSLAKRLTQLKGLFQFLYEDMAGNFEEREQEIVVWNEDCVPRKRTRFRIDCNTMAAGIRAKGEALVTTLRQHTDERIIIMVRYVEILQELTALLGKEGRPIFQIYGEQPEGKRFTEATAFQNSSNGILILTRSSGKRGLDLPAAQVAIFYSPKSEEYVMWQEISRIRSTVTNVKKAYILTYEGSSEEKRLEQLLVAMNESNHRYEFMRD